MASGDDYVLDELMCVLCNNFGKVPRATITSVFIEFYRENELAESKKTLMDVAEQLMTKVDKLKKIKGSLGDGKGRRDLEDILTIYTVIDSKKAILPWFFAADMSRIPTFSEFHVVSRITEVNDTVATQMQQLSSQLSSMINDRVDEVKLAMSVQIDALKTIIASANRR